MQSFFNDPVLLDSHERLANHSLYKHIESIHHLRIFMESHVFAVWDFMSLLKRLQNEITCTAIPWRPSQYPKEVVRFINEIVLGEESDMASDHLVMDHFSLYLKGMEEIGANPARLLSLMKDLKTSLWCTKAESDFVNFNLDLARTGKVHEVAAAFFFGREKIIPDMFTSILNDLEKNFNSIERKKFSYLHYYLSRHIEIDGNEHSTLAKNCLLSLCQEDERKWGEARDAGIKSLILRSALWDEIELKLCQKIIT